MPEYFTSVSNLVCTIVMCDLKVISASLQLVLIFHFLLVFHHSYCGIRDPSWAELRHFVSFLNIQLHDCELSAYCGMAAADILPGFLTFVVKFMIQMSTVSNTFSGHLERIKQKRSNECICKCFVVYIVGLCNQIFTHI